MVWIHLYDSQLLQQRAEGKVPTEWNQIWIEAEEDTGNSEDWEIPRDRASTLETPDA